MEKERVELHVHTNIYAKDGMARVSTLINQAVEWGHPAIAITDHSAVQAFPEMIDTAQKGMDIKIIYGVDAYYVNDSPSAVKGDVFASFDDEFIVVYLETTGLNAQNDRITEIGAVRLKNGELKDDFNTLVNPCIPIPAIISELTGITNEKVKNAPGERIALEAFYAFCGDAKVLVAHNVDFATSFLKAAAARCSMPYSFGSVDTLPVCRLLYPYLKNYLSDTVAKHLKLGKFQHHRACANAAVLAAIFCSCVADMRKLYGITTVDGIRLLLEDGTMEKTRPHHIVLLAKNYTGLKRLYKLIFQSHLNNYDRRPLINKTQLFRYRKDLLLGNACEQGELFQAVISGKSWNKLYAIARFYDYLEIQPLDSTCFTTRHSTARDEERLMEYNRTIVRLGEELHIPVCATGDVHFLDSEDEINRRALMVAQGFSDNGCLQQKYFRSTTDMLQKFAYLGPKKAYEVVVENPNRIAGLVEKLHPIPDGTYSYIASAEERL